MTDTERIERIAECVQKLGYPEMTRDELMEKVRNLSINEIEDEIWDMYCFVEDVCYTLNMQEDGMTCKGCKHRGQFENEFEYGYPCPCLGCKRRARDHYECYERLD